ncbi:hypothetical protein EON66_03060 [archaeon]|nr:MAG: hypothetical protein EON66_03060 [archaeon]
MASVPGESTATHVRDGGSSRATTTQEGEAHTVRTLLAVVQAARTRIVQRGGGSPRCYCK